MIDMYIVDTHALIWYIEGNVKLGSNAKIVFDNAKSILILPMIALAETIDIVQKNRTSIPDVLTLLNRVFSDQRIEIEPLTLDILQESLNASAVPEMHDRLIVSSALTIEKQGFSFAVLTKDNSIIESKLVKNCLVKKYEKNNYLSIICSCVFTFFYKY
jgi:PIN domain nuclease of toxin-antitoxin system